MSNKTIAVDAMGGDHGPEVVVPAGIRVLQQHPNLDIIFVGKQEVLKPLLDQQGADTASRWRIQHASEVVEMDEAPSQALRRKKDSSMWVAIRQVQEGIAQACVSAGNTGALMAISRIVLRTIPGIDRPAIITRIPTCVPNQEVRVLDLGANVDCSADHLYQFAVMGSILAESVDNISQPRVGLLNIGEEDIKGNEVVKRTAELLQQSNFINYFGYVEADAIFKGIADVVVCDGFVGNATLKACEGISRLIGQYAREELQRNIFTRLAALPVLPILRRLRERVDPRQHNGASLIGLNGIVIKSHGRAGVMAFSVAIEEALREVDNDILQQIRTRVAATLQEAPAQ